MDTDPAGMDKDPAGMDTDPAGMDTDSAGMNTDSAVMDTDTTGMDDMSNDQIVKARRTLHRNPTPKDFGIFLEKAIQQEAQKQTDSQEGGYFFKPGSVHENQHPSQDIPFGNKMDNIFDSRSRAGIDSSNASAKDSGDGVDYTARKETFRKTDSAVSGTASDKAFRQTSRAVAGKNGNKQPEHTLDRKTDRLINPGVSSSQRVSAGTEEGSQEAFWKKIAIAIAIVFVFVVIISGFTYPDAAVSVYRALFLAGAVLAYLFAYRTKSTLLAVLGGIAIGFLGTMFDLIFISMYVGEKQILASDLLMVLWIFGTFAAAVFMGVKITNNAMYYTEINRKK